MVFANSARIAFVGIKFDVHSRVRLDKPERSAERANFSAEFPTMSDRRKRNEEEREDSNSDTGDSTAADSTPGRGNCVRICGSGNIAGNVVGFDNENYDRNAENKTKDVNPKQISANTGAVPEPEGEVKARHGSADTYEKVRQDSDRAY